MPQDFVPSPPAPLPPSSADERPTAPILIKIIGVFMVMQGLGYLLFSGIPLLLGSAGRHWDLFSKGSQALLLGLGLIVVAFGLWHLRKWALYAYTVLITIGIGSMGYDLWKDPKDGGTIITIVFGIAVLVYLWAIRKKFDLAVHESIFSFRKVTGFLNIVSALYLFAWANILFWLSLVGVFGAFREPSGQPSSFLLLTLLISPFFILAAIMLFTRSKHKYYYGLFVWGLLLVSYTSWPSFKEKKLVLNMSVLGDFLLFMAPILVLVFTMWLDSKTTSQPPA